MELTRFYQYDFERQPGVCTLRSTQDGGEVYTYRDFMVDFCEKFADYPAEDFTVELDASSSNLDLFLSIAEQDGRTVTKLQSRVTLLDLTEVIRIASQVKLSGWPYFEYEGYYDFIGDLIMNCGEEITSVDRKRVMELIRSTNTESDKELWYSDLLELLHKYPLQERGQRKRLIHGNKPKFIKLITLERRYLYCPVESCELLRKSRQDRLETYQSSEVVNAFIFMVFPYHEPESHPIEGVTETILVDAIRLALKYKFDRASHQYGNDEECAWIITTRLGKIIGEKKAADLWSLELIQQYLDQNY